MQKRNKSNIVEFIFLIFQNLWIIFCVVIKSGNSILGKTRRLLLLRITGKLMNFSPIVVIGFITVNASSIVPAQANPNLETYKL